MNIVYANGGMLWDFHLKTGWLLKIKHLPIDSATTFRMISELRHPLCPVILEFVFRYSFLMWSSLKKKMREPKNNDQLLLPLCG